MSSLTAIFGNAQTDEESEKLLELYWNRAELKKEFANLRDETFRLREQIKEHQGSAARYQQKVEHLENLLLDPEWVYNVLVFYQLRALNERCKLRVANFAEQLKQQREKRQHSKLLDAWHDKKQAESQAVQEQIGELRMQVHRLDDQLQAERERYASMNALVRFFRKRSVANALDAIASDIDMAQQNEADMLQELESISNRDAPDTQGLDVASKRSINFMILAYAQQLFLHFRDDNLADLVKEAGDKSAGAIRYGSKMDCDMLLENVIKRGKVLGTAPDNAAVLKQRAKLISEKALFNDDDDAVPVAGTVATIFVIDQNGAIREKDKNLLGENYWALSGVLSR